MKILVEFNREIESDLLNKVIEYANKHHDGHFTLMKFTTNWRACYGTINDRFEIGKMVSGNSKEEVLKKLLKNPISVYDMDK